MSSTNIYPPLKQLLPLENLPIELASIDGFIDQIFQNLYFQNLIFSNSKYGDSGYYRFDLKSYKKIGYEIPGTNGLKLLLNPDYDEAGSETSTFEGLSFEYQLEIVKYITGLSPSNFQGDPLEFFNLLLSVINLSTSEVLQKTIEALVGSEDPIDQFIIDFNTVRGATNNIQKDSGLDTDTYLDLLLQIEDRGFNGLSVVFEDYLEVPDTDAVFQRIKSLISSWVGDIDFNEIFKKLFIPEFRFSTGELAIGVEFPDRIFQPVNPINPDEKTILRLNIGSLNYDSEVGINLKSTSSIEFPKSYILNTKFSLELQGMKVDLSKAKNIPEADADGRPADFIGVYITEGTIGFPTAWNHDPEDEGNTAELYVNNLLVGTGGISGTIGMRALDPEADPEVVPPIIQAKFGQDFKVALKGFDITFQQNAIIGSNIHGSLHIPGFKNEDGSPAEIDIEIHIGQDGEFNIVASSEQALKKIKVPNAFTFGIESLFFGRETGEDGRFYIGISGELDFTINGAVAQYLPDKIDIEKMLIYDDGTFEFEGGKLTLPKAITLSFGPAKLSITGIHMGAYEKNDRKYKFFGFDGGVKVNPGGVEAHGKGIKYYYTTDDPFDWFIGLESLSVDIIIPSGADPEKAAVAIRGFLSISEPKVEVADPDPHPELTEILKNSQEYIGGVSVSIPKFKGLKGSAAMRLNPKVPSFIIDLGIELSTPIVLGATGLGIYGFRGLLGKKYVATKTAAGVPEDGEWWQYYKAKIDPDYRPGIQVSKFSIKNGFSFGAGVSLATASDSGKMFSSKLFFLLSLPDVFLFQGQAQFLKERIGLDTDPDPPFFAIIAITSKSIEAGFGVNYKLRDNGKIVTVDGIIELGFFWGDSSAWYVNVGRETPEDRRIQARLFDILNMYFYLMMSSQGMRLGAGVKFELKKTFGPLSAELKAYIDTFGKISRRPKQIGGAIKMGGSVKLKVCGFGFGVSGGATLAAEAPKPHIVTGEFEVCVTVLKKERCARFEFTWSFDETLDQSRVPLLVGTVGDSETLDEADVNRVAGSIHMVSGERFPIASKILAGSGPIPAPDTWINDAADDYRIPMDSFIDIEFKKGMNVNPNPGVNNLGRIGGQSSPAKYVEFVPPLRGKSDRVRHEYYLKDIEIFYWNEELNSGAGGWEEYDFYEALLPIYENASGTLATAVSEAAEGDVQFPTLNDIKWGYWQQQQPGLNNKLRILATSPLSYAASTGNAFNIEDMGINGSTIFCPGDLIPLTCVTFDDADLYTTYANNTLRTYENVIFRIVDGDGVVLNASYGGLSNGLIIPFGCKIELFFNEPMKIANLLLSSSASQVVVKYYRRNTAEEFTNGLSTYEYELIDTQTVNGGYNTGIDYTCFDEGAIDHITIEPNTCALTGTINVNVTNQSTLLNIIKDFLQVLIDKSHLTDSSVELYPAFETEYNSFLNSPLYTGENADTVELIQTHLSSTSLSFRVVDSNGFDCLYRFDLKSEVYKFDFATIIDVKSISMYTADDTVGANYNFLVIFNVEGGGTVEFIGSTCQALSYAYDRCATGFYELCYLSLENYLANQGVPSESVQDDNNTTLIDSINKTLYPVWRPNTTYAIRVQTEDRLFREAGSYPIASYKEWVAYGFKTAGPIGHFHQYPALDGTEEVVKDRTDYGALAAQGKGNEFRLTNLRSYIDYSKSYPNADGQLINAKPLFYMGAELRLFYLYNYVYQFYTDWVDYANSTESDVIKIAESSLEVQIVNPAPSDIPEETLSEGFDANFIQRNDEPGDPPSLINEVNNDVSILNNLLANGNPCADFEPVIPIDISTKKLVNLKPSKLYNAQFVAKYKPAFDGVLATEEFQSIVHSYVFQTSRYSSFEEQVHSYTLKEGVEPETDIQAVYPLKLTKDFDSVLAQKVISDDLDLQQDILIVQYTDRFEQLMNGVFTVDLNALQAPVCTEFNLVHKDEQLVGILIRNPEPFNDPKIPVPPADSSATNPMETLIVFRDNAGSWESEEDYIAIHSKDKSQIFIAMRDFHVEFNKESSLKLQFKYLKYNGVSYDSVSTDVFLNLTNYTI